MLDRLRALEFPLAWTGVAAVVAFVLVAGGSTTIANVLRTLPRDVPVTDAEVWSSDGVTWEVDGGWCRADLRVDELTEASDRVAVRLRARGGNPGLDCGAPSITVTLDEPLGDRAFVDLVSGERLVVCGTVAPGVQAGGDVPCR